MLNTLSSTMHLNLLDNVVIARVEIPQGTKLPDRGVTAGQRIPRGHKMALTAIPKGEPILRYGQVIGFAKADIAPGDHIHVHNCEIHEFARDHAFGVDAKPTVYIQPQATFQGIIRADGRVATRNYIGILTSVNCSAGTARYVAEAFRRNPFTGDQGLLADYPNIDGVVALTHKTGCGMAIAGDGMDTLRRTIAGYASHVNFAAVLIIGLGCETNQIGPIMQSRGIQPSAKMATMIIQETGGARKTVEAGIAKVCELLPEANAVTRVTVPASHLNVALQCGGSDSFSGLTANPALGYASDLIVRHGGTVVLTETTEIYGAEHLLTRRAVSPEVGQKLLDRLTWWEEYTRRNGGEIDNNPSPGNKAGGLTNIVEKSLGAVAKAGTTNLVDVVGYADPVTEKGLVVMDGPGFDPVSATGQIAGGCNVLCFTTGRGSVFGCKPTPSLKLATNTPLYDRQPDDMDINCGTIADGVETVEECGQRIFETILRIASGERTKSEEIGFGDDEFAPWQLGATV
ncbi:altronate dehydratase [Acidisoma cellulosilytica]|uniref:Altronate dehydratase n=1 Tax=Acidisoma cellulosilyticum TaxID=2802395 RepID=A0A963Z1A8_9PROT|nr:altronate dehydratase family protein [Acidisoma cellulosilyticum]MCB8880821.1 altronate dehydratase [Acidisoma cellulosilyticum]